MVDAGHRNADRGDVTLLYMAFFRHAVRYLYHLGDGFGGVVLLG
ncbi:MAG TPA: hypothetical protein VNY30_15865 [Bryobacteraceae bacterium]|jgi:hypothetical protein|nr:hypothetical protein [Bryobacteraceae bacterium]